VGVFFPMIMLKVSVHDSLKQQCHLARVSDLCVGGCICVPVACTSCSWVHYGCVTATATDLAKQPA
jgi:hypothetical protein